MKQKIELKKTIPVVLRETKTATRITVQLSNIVFENILFAKNQSSEQLPKLRFGVKAPGAFILYTCVRSYDVAMATRIHLYRKVIIDESIIQRSSINL